MNERDTPGVMLTDTELALAVETSMHDLFRSFSALPGAEVEERPAWSIHHAFPSSPMFKGVWGTDLALEEVDEAVPEMLGWQRQRGAPYVFWWHGPACRPTDVEALGARLQAHGFAPFEIGAPGQVADLDALDWDALERTPPGFTVERVADDAGLDEFAVTLTEGFGMPEWAARSWVDATRALGIGRAPWELHLGRLAGRPVATCFSFCGAGVATVLGIAASPDVRGRGIGAAITLAGLAEPRERGYRYGVLFATELGAPVYRRLGFRDTDVAISRWLWAAE